MSDYERIEDQAHSRRGASSASRFLNCAGSVNLLARLTDQGLVHGSVEAAEGTVAHFIGHACIEDKRDAFEYIGRKMEHDGHKFDVDKEMADSAQLYADFVDEKMRQYKDQGAVIQLETSLESVLDEDAYGTPDTVIYVPGSRIIVVDFKHGYVPVEPWAEQLKYYGYLAYENRPDYMRDEGEPKVIELWIVQPRHVHHKGPRRRHVSNAEELTNWFVGELIPGIERTRDPEALLKMGAHCRFCPAADSGQCPAFRKEVMDFPTDMEVDEISDQDLGEALIKLDVLMKKRDVWNKEAYQRAMRGRTIPGRKVVKKKANRVFRDKIEAKDEETGEKVTVALEPAARKAFGDDAFTDPVLKSPPNIEKLKDGKKFVRRWAFTPNAGYTLAPESDSREAVKLDGTEYFGDVE